METDVIKKEIDEIKNWEEKIKRNYLKYKTKNILFMAYDFQQYETIRSFDDNINTCKASIVKAEEDQRNLL